MLPNHIIYFFIAESDKFLAPKSTQLKPNFSNETFCHIASRSCKELSSPLDATLIGGSRYRLPATGFCSEVFVVVVCPWLVPEVYLFDRSSQRKLAPEGTHITFSGPMLPSWPNFSKYTKWYCRFTAQTSYLATLPEACPLPQHANLARTNLP